MMTVVEKMVRAVRMRCVARKELSLDWAVSAPFTEQERDDALAALRALREPSEGMIDAAQKIVLNDVDVFLGPECVSEVLRAAFDFAIHEAETA